MNNYQQAAVTIVSLALGAIVFLFQEIIGSDAGLGVGFMILFYLVITIGVRQSKNFIK